MKSSWAPPNHHCRNLLPAPATAKTHQAMLSPDLATLSTLLVSSPFAALQRETMSSSYGSNTSSERSLSASPSPTSRRPFPSLALGAMGLALKSGLSPPSTTSSDYSLSLATSASSLTSTSFASCAYPDWPKSNDLSPASSSTCGNQASSYISDDELLDLAQLDLYNNFRIPEGALPYQRQEEEISWESTKQPPLVLQSMPSPQKTLPVSKRRRRSSPFKRRKMVQGMSPIAEAPE